MTQALRMSWVDLAFLHWQMPLEALRPHVPESLQLDTFRNVAWVGVTPFRMTRVRPLLAPPIPTANDFPELNVRTYVRHGAHSGVYFFSLDAASRLAVKAARTATNLPYFHARMKHRRTKDDVHYESRRTHGGARPAEFRARYRPTGPVFQSQPGSLEHWLTERYSLFVTRGAGLLRVDIEHEPWSLQPATADVEVNTMAHAAGIELPAEKPHVCFSRQLDVVAHLPVPAD
jgi:uncharacterized protein YqjF (DUF2071 family)